MRLAYAGTAHFGALVLSGLLENRSHDVVLVVTRPDRPRGRHGTPQPSAVKEVAVAADLPLLQPEQLAGAAVERLLDVRAEVLVVCAYGEIIRRDVLDRVLTIVVHPSAVPHWRGAAPVERALMAGETEIGVAVLKMSDGVDEGPIGDLRQVHIPPEADAGAAFATLAGPAVEGLLATLEHIAAGDVTWRPQEGEPSYAGKLEKSERSIDWARSARELADQVRALSPTIGARTDIGGRALIVWRARPLAEDPDDGERLVVPTGDGFLEILELQAPGGRRQNTAAFLRGAGRWLTQK